jgi:hypothetical protein
VRQNQVQPLVTPGALSTHSAQYKATPHPAPKPAQPANPRSEPTYHPASMSGANNSNLTR